MLLSTLREVEVNLLFTVFAIFLLPNLLFWLKHKRMVEMAPNPAIVYMNLQII